MPDELTNGDAVDIIENEGLGYAVQHYVGPESFKDPTTRRLWRDADRVLTDLCAHLARETGREVQ